MDKRVNEEGRTWTMQALKHHNTEVVHNYLDCCLFTLYNVFEAKMLDIRKKEKNILENSLVTPGTKAFPVFKQKIQDSRHMV